MPVSANHSSRPKPKRAKGIDPSGRDVDRDAVAGAPPPQRRQRPHIQADRQSPRADSTSTWERRTPLRQRGGVRDCRARVYSGRQIDAVKSREDQGHAEKMRDGRPGNPGTEFGWEQSGGKRLLGNPFPGMDDWPAQTNAPVFNRSGQPVSRSFCPPDKARCVPSLGSVSEKPQQSDFNRKTSADPIRQAGRSCHIRMQIMAKNRRPLDRIQLLMSKSNPLNTSATLVSCNQSLHFGERRSGGRRIPVRSERCEASRTFDSGMG